MVAGASPFFQKSRPSLQIVIVFNSILGKYCSLNTSITNCMYDEDEQKYKSHQNILSSAPRSSHLTAQFLWRWCRWWCRSLRLQLSAWTQRCCCWAPPRSHEKWRISGTSWGITAGRSRTYLCVAPAGLLTLKAGKIKICTKLYLVSVGW